MITFLALTLTFVWNLPYVAMVSVLVIHWRGTYKDGTAFTSTDEQRVGKLLVIATANCLANFWMTGKI